MAKGKVTINEVICKGCALCVSVCPKNVLALSTTKINPAGYNLEALSRCTSLAALTLDSLPHCGLVVSVISYTGNNHKSSYLPCSVVFVICPIITVVLMLLFITVTGM